MLLSSALAALRQVLSPPLRAIVLRAVGLTILLLATLSWSLTSGIGWYLARHPISAGHPALDAAVQVVAGAGIVVLAFYLLPVVSALVAGFFLDEAAAVVERIDFPADPPGAPLAFGRSVLQGLRFAGLALLVNAGALLLLLLPGVNVAIFVLANSYLLGREYFEMAAGRFLSPGGASALRRAHGAAALAGGALLAGLMLVPVLNLATPVFGIALMVHVHKRVARSERRALRAA